MDTGSPLKSIFTRERRISCLSKTEALFASFSITEKAIFLVSAGIFTLGALLVARGISDTFIVEIPARGGSLTEGILGTPRFINPLLATSDADKDLSALVYSGLLKREPSGNFVPDLASHYEVSEDGLVYSFTIRDNAMFHDGRPVTSDDVEFTVLKAQDVALKSPRQINWDGVTVQKTGSHEISFALKRPYAPFISNLTLGILPKHIWQSFQTDQFPFSSFNLDPIGSGPYRISSVQRSGQGIPTSIHLASYKGYALGQPYLSNISLVFHANEKSLQEALLDGSIESASNLSPSSAQALSETTRIIEAPLTRIFGVFFNQNNKEPLAHKTIRQALELSIDKRAIIDNVLMGYGSVVNGPLPPSTDSVASARATPTEYRDIDQARALVAKDGWRPNPSTGALELKGKSGTTTLSLSLSTANIPELVEAAKYVEGDWNAIGIKTDVKIFEPSDLNQTIIRPRKYEALLFGMVTGGNPDLYAFWHSSQRNDPGLNIAMYTNAKADKLLESMRQTSDAKGFAEQYESFRDEIAMDSPAVFLWSPSFAYAIPDKVKGVEIRQITNPSDRFLNIEKWHTETDRVWEIFSRNN